MTPITPERLAAYADGELDDRTAREVAAAIAADPALQAEVEAHRELRARLFARFGPIAEQPVPERLRAAVFTPPKADVVDFAAARARREHRPVRQMPRWAWMAGPAMAASLALAFFGLGTGRAPTGPYAGEALAQALDGQLAATQPADAPVRVLLSFRDAGGRFCRGFSGASEAGIACRDSTGWRLEKRFGGSQRAATEYRQAGNDAADVLAAAQDMAAGPALDAPGEAAAARRGWR